MPNAIYQICCLILLFFLFSVTGWCIEVTLKYFQYHRFINRGFLIGPYCPIYGSGAVLVTVIVGGFARFEKSYGITFVISFFACGLLEYAVSYYMEKMFHARWWDYSQKPMNLDGRIWIGNLILFGIGGTVIVKVIDPFLYAQFAKLSDTALAVCTALIAAVMGTDAVVSHFIMKLVKVGTENSKADDTETIGREIHELLSNRSALHRRIAEAYPDVIYRTDRIKERIKSEYDKLVSEKLEAERAKFADETKKLRQNLSDKMASEKDKLSLLSVQDKIIGLQQKLISLLEHGASPTDKSIIKLENEINSCLEEEKQLEASTDADTSSCDKTQNV